MKFHPVYVVLPAVIFALSIALCAVLAPEIEEGKIAISFNFDGEPKNWKSLAFTLTVFLGLQGALFLASLAAVYLGRRSDKEKLLPLVGNFLGVGQIILGMVMLEVLWYNSQGHHLLSMTAIFITILALLIAAPSAFFIFLFFRTREKT
jgi:hypothetical protein